MNDDSWGVIWANQNPCIVDSVDSPYLQRIKNKGSLTSVRIETFAQSGYLFLAASSKKPHYHSEPDIATAIFCGELSNRQQLTDELSLSDKCLENDARLVVEGFSRLGKALFSKLSGGYCFIVYQNDGNKLSLVTDRQGDYRLYYAAIDEAVLISSSLETLLSTSLVDRKTDRQSVAAYFANQSSYTGRSYIKGVNKVMPGYCVQIGEDGIQNERYWQFVIADSYRNASIDEMVEGFYEQLNDALNCCLKGHSRIALLLSGGLDSSSIMALMMHADQRERDILAVTHVFDKYPQCDERVYLKDLYSRYKFNHLYVNADDCLPLAHDPETLHRGINEIWVPPMIRQRRKSYPVIRSKGYDHFLSGEFGDHLFGSYRYWLRDLVKTHKSAGDIFQAVCHQVSTSTAPWYADNVLRRLLPFNGIRAGRFNQCPAFLTPFSRKSVREISRLSSQDGFRFEQDRYQACLNQNSSDLSLIIRNESNHYGLQPLFPYRDLNLINYTLNLPAYLFYDYASRQHKHILRRSMTGLLPDSLRLRKNATVYNDIFRDSLTGQHGNAVREILMDSGRTWPEFIRESYLLPKIGQANISDGDLHLIWNCICYELWIKKLISR